MNPNIDARERAYDALLAARQLIGQGSPSEANRARLDELVATAHRNGAEYARSAGLPVPPEPTDPVAYVDDQLDYLERPAEGLPGDRTAGMRHPTRPGGASWADALISSGRYHPGTMGAGIIDPAGTFPVAVPISGTIVTDARRARFVRELIPMDPAPTGFFRYRRQTVRTFNAAAVAKLAKKPTSIITGKGFEDRTRTIAHLTEPVAKQDLSDVDVLREFVDGELRYGLDLELDRQVVSADGTGEDMTGILESGIGSQAFSSDILVTTRKALTALQLIEVVPTAWVINPTDWETIELTAMDQLSAGQIVTAPVAVLEHQLWSLPVMVSNAVPVGTGLIGDFAGSARLFQTGGAVVDWSEATYDPDADSGNGATDFERNALRFRAEGRWGLAVTRPLAFVAVDLAAGS